MHQTSNWMMALLLLAIAIPLVEVQAESYYERPLTIACADRQTYATPDGPQMASVVIERYAWTQETTANVTIVFTVQADIVERHERNLTISLLEDPNSESPPRWIEEFSIASPPGSYPYSVVLWPQDKPRVDYNWWGYAGGSLHVGQGPDLSQETMIVTGRCAASGLDLTGDGRDDLTIAPGAESQEGWGILATNWRGARDLVESKFTLAFTPPSPFASTNAILDGDVVRAILNGADLGDIIIQAGQAVPTRMVNGNFHVELKPSSSEGYTGQQSDRELVLRAFSAIPIPAPMLRLGHYDGRFLHLNLTQGDFDADGASDLFMWALNGTDVEAAAASPEQDRRIRPTRINIHVVVQETQNETILRFDLFRYDGSHDGAWIEMQRPDRLFTALVNGSRAAELAYSLDLPADEGFVQRIGDTMWVWVGHFSTRTLTIVVPKSPPGIDVATSNTESMVPEDPAKPGESERVDVPVEPMLPLIALLVATFARRPRGR